MTEPRTFTYTDPHGVEITAYRFDADRPQAVVQIAHGVGEHARRYDDFARRLVEAGYTVIHVTWAQLWDEPRLARRINAVLAQGPSERFRRRPPVGAERAS